MQTQAQSQAQIRTHLWAMIMMVLPTPTSRRPSMTRPCARARTHTHRICTCQHPQHNQATSELRGLGSGVQGFVSSVLGLESFRATDCHLSSDEATSALDVYIQGGGGLIAEENGRLLDQCARECNPLPLSPAQSAARCVAVRKLCAFLERASFLVSLRCLCALI